MGRLVRECPKKRRLRTHHILARVALAVTLLIPIPAITTLFSGVYLLPDPIGDGASLVAEPFLFFGLTITPLAIFLFFERDDRLNEGNEWKLIGIEFAIYLAAFLVLFSNFMGTFFFMDSPLLMGSALTAPPLLTLLAGFLLLRTDTTPSEALELPRRERSRTSVRVLVT